MQIVPECAQGWNRGGPPASDRAGGRRYARAYLDSTMGVAGAQTLVHARYHSRGGGHGLQGTWGGTP
jgi:hypothetical protein